MDNTKRHPFIQIAGVCLILAPAVMFLADLFWVSTGRMFEWSLILWLAFVLFVPAIFGLTHILYADKKSGFVVIGGLSAFFGAMAGASMQVLFRVYAVLAEAGAPQAIETLRGTLKLIALTQMIGIFFPIGLLILAVCLYRRGIFHSIIPMLLALGAFLFPIGRIGGFAAAILGSGVLLTAAFSFIGWQTFYQTVTRQDEPGLEENFAKAV